MVLNQAAREVIVASVWSKAENVGGQRDAGYSLFLDVGYVDGTPLWAQMSPFRTGTHDWQQAKVKIVPAKPIKVVAFYMLFRSHSGKASFKQPVLCQSVPDKDAAELRRPAD